MKIQYKDPQYGKVIEVSEEIGKELIGTGEFVDVAEVESLEDLIRVQLEHAQFGGDKAVTIARISRDKAVEAADEILCKPCKNFCPECAEVYKKLRKAFEKM